MPCDGFGIETAQSKSASPKDFTTWELALLRNTLLILWLAMHSLSSQAEMRNHLCFTKSSSEALIESLWSHYRGAKELLLPDKSLAFQITKNDDLEIRAYRTGKYKPFDHEQALFSVQKETNAVTVAYVRSPSRKELGQCLVQKGNGCADPIAIEGTIETGHCKVSEPVWNAFIKLQEGRRTYFFDSESIVHSGLFVAVWIKSVEAYEPTNSGSWSNDSRFHLFCEANTIKLMAQAYHDRDGNFISAPTAFPEERPITAGSIGAEFHRVACSKSFPKGDLRDGYHRVKGNDTQRYTRSLIEFRDEGAIQKK